MSKKPTSLPEWRIIRIKSSPAAYVGHVRAADEIWLVVAATIVGIAVTIAVRNRHDTTYTHTRSGSSAPRR